MALYKWFSYNIYLEPIVVFCSVRQLEVKIIFYLIFEKIINCNTS